MVARRERTRHLIELGGLVQKAGLVNVTDDDRAVLYGAFLDLAQRLRGDDGSTHILLFRRRGVRAFAIESEGVAKTRAHGTAVVSPGQKTGDDAK